MDLHISTVFFNKLDSVSSHGLVLRVRQASSRPYHKYKGCGFKNVCPGLFSTINWRWGGPQAGRIGSGTRPGARAQGARERSSRGGWIGGCSLAAPSLLDSLGVWVSEKPDSSGSGIGSH